jgi:WD40 repeat protein
LQRICRLDRLHLIGLLALFAGAMHLSIPRSHAAEPTTQPILRVETGMHTTLIRNMVVDAPRNRIITGSDDKTVRIWQMPDARLISVLRAPMDVSHEGQIFAVAVSPDGKTVAASGWTGWDWEGSNSIYLFDAATGVLTRRIGGLVNTVNALAWTPNGEHLVAGLHMAFRGQTGFVAVKVADGKIVASDNQYNDKVMDLDVTADGRVITTSFDGLIRLYDKDFRLIGRRPAVGGTKPITVRSSPDGNRLAIGFSDTSAVSVHSARDLSPLHQAATAKLPNQASFLTVVWSSEGNYIYAGGEYKGPGANPVYRWGAQGRGPPEQIPMGTNRISRLEQMPEGRIAFASEDPGVGVIEADGSVRSYRGPDVVNFSDARAGVLVSKDAAVVSYPVSRDGKTRRHFSALGAGDQTQSGIPAAEVLPPLLAAPGMTIADWKDGFKPTINGITAPLDPYEISRTYAIAPDGESVLLGTEWAIRLFNRDAKELWNVRLPAVAWAVNISGNGRLAIAALSDGTLRWYRMSDGREILAYFPHANSRDWIAWTPDGYYTSSIFGDNYIGWHLNRGKDLTPDFYRAVQFDRILYRPDVVAQHFRSAMGSAPSDAQTALTDADFKIGKLREIAPPRLKLAVQSITAGASPKATLKLDGEKTALDIRDYTVFVNNIPVTPNRERQLRGRESREFNRTIDIDLPARANEIRVESFNGVSMGVVETFITLDRDIAPPREAGNLYLLAVGINVFPDLPEGMHLAFAARDAEQLTAELERKGKSFYKQIHTRILSDSTRTKPTRRAINDALRFVQQAQANDTVVIFLASHGLSDPAGNYYFVPSDVTRKDVTGIQKGEKAESLIPWTAFSDALRGAAGKRILIVDTCHAGRIEGKLESHSLMKRSASSLFPMIMASKGEEQSQEYEPAKHGLFTYAVIESMKADTDRNKDGLISIQEIFDAALPLVDKLREKSIGPQSPQIVAPALLGNLPLLNATFTP